MTAALMDPVTDSRSFAPLHAISRFDACLRRFAAVGLRLIVTSPADGRVFVRGTTRFSERHVDPAEHARWETAYRVFCGRGRQPSDRGSWRILAVDRGDRVLGAITARLFCGEFVPEYLHLRTLLEATGPVYREHCEMAVADLAAASARDGRTLGEVSGWAVAPSWHAALVAATLARAMAALMTSFDDPWVVVAADNRRGEVGRLLRRGAAPLGVLGRFALPPFVHHATGAWLRFLVIDAPAFFARSGGRPEADLALLRERAALVSMA